MADKQYKKKVAVSLAISKVKELILQADKIYKKNPDLANKNAAAAKKIILKHRLRLGPEIKRRICKGCNSFLVPQASARIRTRKGRVIIYCKKCKRITRVGYK